MHSQAACQPFFLEHADQRLFSLACRPGGARASRGVLVCPPFAEEMNRSRRTVRELCGALAASGALALSTDLRGTGDSSGEFGDARWSDWLADLGAALDWLARQGCTQLSLVAIRAGALLARELLRDRAGAFARLALWQPVLTGQSVVTDLLRARVAAAATTGASESVARLRERLAAGEAVEAAGYALSPALAAALDGARFAADAAPLLPPTLWAEAGSDAAAPLRIPAQQLLEALRAAGATVTLARVEDPPFWSTTETTVGRASIAATVPFLAGAA